MLMTVSKAAEELQTSVATIYRCIHAGAPCRRFGPSGKQYRVDPDQLLDWMDDFKDKLLTQLLIGLGVSPETAREDACKIEHDLSVETFDAIREHARRYSQANVE